jgi:hypothetical protein
VFEPVEPQPVEPVAEPEPEPVVAEQAATEMLAPVVEEDENATFDELFSMRGDVPVIDEESDDESADGKKKKKKKKYVEVTYDPDHDAMVVKKKRKRAGDEWGEDVDW